MKVNGIVAVSENGAIGIDNTLPWSLPNDLKMFRKTTKGCTVIMGRKTFESIGRPLPKRHNIVISSKLFEGVQTVLSPEEALSNALYNGAQEVFVIGGAQIYRALAHFITRWYVTRVHTEIEGDTYWGCTLEDFELTSNELHSIDEKHEFRYSFRIYDRKEV